MNIKAPWFSRLVSNPEWSRIARTVHGKLAMAMALAAALYLCNAPNWLALSVFVFIMSVLPRYRRVVLTVATAYMIWVVHPFAWRSVLAVARETRTPFIVEYWYLPLAGVFLFSWLLTLLAHRFPGSWAMKRPVRNLVVAYIALLWVASYATMPPWLAAGLWVFVILFGKLLWFVAYSLHDARHGDRTGFQLQLGHYVPFWGSTNVPFPKGESFLRRIEAKTPKDLALSQMMGMKLIAWTVVLTFLSALLHRIVYGDNIGGLAGEVAGLLPLELRVPYLQQALQAYVRGAPFPRLVNWLCVVANFVNVVLGLTLMGHTYIAVCRMAGFNAPANTDRPFTANTIAEFYNRIYYYFKELLVDFFFYPVYFRYFKRHPRLRLFVATASAAFFGNVLYHYLRDIGVIHHRGAWKALVAFQVYLFYGLVLGTAIGLSQIATMARKERGLPPKRRGVVSSLGVLAFYCLIMILDDPPRTFTLVDYGRFTLNLFLPLPR